jgi:hypothetical protein
MQPSTISIILIEHRSFSDGEAVDSVETQKSRIVLRELENGWWILAVRIPHVHSNIATDITVVH